MNYGSLIKSLVLSTIVTLSLSSCYEKSEFFSDINALPSSELGEMQRSSRVQIHNDQLWIDGEAQPQLFGAELQYFRLRGGQGPNIAREKVIQLWNKALDRMVEAGMNSICFYIPWDFHEYAEGQFDFTGTADEDHDGRPDYPSRDLITFFKLIQEHGINKIMVRPGPYINAEWGPLGFGAIPLWFHNKYPNSHMKNAQGQSAKLYDYHNADLQRHTQIWFKTLYDQVLKNYVGRGRPIFAFQIDNETNFMWQSIYNIDYSKANVDRYRSFLQSRYLFNLDTLNKTYGLQLKSWQELEAPVKKGLNVAQDHDWYDFQDFSIFHYLRKIQGYWRDLGVTQREVLFTLAESYNAAGEGLIPNPTLRNHPSTGMMTVNLYPKTYEPGSNPLLNNSFKADHDVRFADDGNDAYFVNYEKNEWVLGPEIQGGWWKGTPVSPEARRQTYLTTLGHGLKALFVYYFTEGDNWFGTYEKTQVKKLYDQLRSTSKYKSIPDHELGDGFWDELRKLSQEKYFANSEPRWILGRSDEELDTLFFDAPLDNNADAREHFEGLKNIGTKLVKPYSEWMGKSKELTDDVTFIKDPNEQAPQKVEGLDNVLVNTDWSAGLYAYMLHAGYNAKTHIYNPKLQQLPRTKIWVRQDYGYLDPAFLESSKKHLEHGGVIINFLDDSLAKALGYEATGKEKAPDGPGQFRTRSGFGRGTQLYGIEKFPTTFARTYRNIPSDCQSLLRLGDNTVAYTCPANGGGNFIQISASLHDIYNVTQYFEREDFEERNLFLKTLLSSTTENQIDVATSKENSKVVIFARKAPDHNQYLITLKSGHKLDTELKMRLNFAQTGNWLVKNVFTGETQNLSGEELRNQGVGIQLKPFDSTVYWVEELKN
ncbi:MAG: beta-galactosidase [Proteobacteria bacterium]|nr:beta-galactosidase [Pseudomonadota bacterium]